MTKRISVSDLVKSDQEIILDSKLKNLCNSFVNLHQTILASLNFNVENEEAQIKMLCKQVIQLITQHSQDGFTCQQLSRLQTVLWCCLAIPELLREKCKLLNEAARIKEQKKSAAFSRRPSSHKNRLSKNIIIVTPAKFDTRRNCPRTKFDRETKWKLEDWFKKGDFTKESTLRVARLTGLEVVQVKNWISNKRRKSNKIVDDMVKHIINVWAPSRGTQG